MLKKKECLGNFRSSNQTNEAKLLVITAICGAMKRAKKLKI